jgi:hypothetical protein
MEKGFCRMTEASSGTQVAINAYQVRYVRPTAEPQACAVYFDSNDCVIVAGTLDQVTLQLRSVIP